LADSVSFTMSTVGVLQVVRVRVTIDIQNGAVFAVHGGLVRVAVAPPRSNISQLQTMKPNPGAFSLDVNESDVPHMFVGQVVVEFRYASQKVHVTLSLGLSKITSFVLTSSL